MVAVTKPKRQEESPLELQHSYKAVDVESRPGPLCPGCADMWYRLLMGLLHEHQILYIDSEYYRTLTLKVQSRCYAHFGISLATARSSRRYRNLWTSHSSLCPQCRIPCCPHKRDGEGITEVGGNREEAYKADSESLDTSTRLSLNPRGCPPEAGETHPLIPSSIEGDKGRPS